ncbi:aconitase family protein [Lichenihabitans sp. Uapishka_5]|uniref:cis-3-hydroxy-L-proline dehydratase n=1 Tax=Lichenihabitans sp. Uapishka_5 TaxID=3037302 RepID=UPI0029E7E499|nr:aconitase family protein [Lichenihabitans sp. Uapishka_5]MDX7951833.1 aconitase family protein [Lichenihabitans sp. Uapishka_5]
MTPTAATGRRILGGLAQGRIVCLSEPLSFWGGVDPASGSIVDAHHPQCGVDLCGAIVLMSTSRGSCSGSGVLLDLALAGRAPAALVFTEPEDVATLGALVAVEMFGHSLPVLRLSAQAFSMLARAKEARITDTLVQSEGVEIPLSPTLGTDLVLSVRDRALLNGEAGEAAAQAMRILVAMARQQGAAELIDVRRAHIDGCIYAGPANLAFAEAMEAKGGRVCIPTTTNAISVDRENWRAQGVCTAFGEPAMRLADAYVRMGCRPTFTCAPYLLDDVPERDEAIGWSESNAVIFANSVLGARTAKHPDFLDLCIALTGRAPLIGPYLDAERRARLIIDVDLPDGADASAWPLIGYLAGHAARDRVPLLRGLEKASPSRDDLKALCAAFGTTAAAPMLHIEGVTPEADAATLPTAPRIAITPNDLAEGWRRLNAGPEAIDLVAIGSPHASLEECRTLAEALGGKSRHPRVTAIVTVGRQVMGLAEAEGTRARLTKCGVTLISDLCWCSISRPVFPVDAVSVITTSAKYAHYGPGLSGCTVRLGTLADCVGALVSGQAASRLPDWLQGQA